MNEESLALTNTQSKWFKPRFQQHENHMKKIAKTSSRNVVPELREGPAMWGTVEIVLVWWDDTVAGDAVPLGLLNLAWSAAGF